MKREKTENYILLALFIIISAHGFILMFDFFTNKEVTIQEINISSHRQICKEMNGEYHLIEAGVIEKESCKLKNIEIDYLQTLTN